VACVSSISLRCNGPYRETALAEIQASGDYKDAVSQPELLVDGRQTPWQWALRGRITIRAPAIR
jgi:hypothetical protein